MVMEYLAGVDLAEVLHASGPLEIPYAVGCPASGDPYSIAAGPDGNLWFTESMANKIGRIAPATGAITEFPTVAGASPGGIARGPI